MHRVALATSQKLPDLDVDERFLVEALASLGVQVRPIVWSDERIDYDAFDLVVIRTTWDYTEQIDAFLAWAESTAARAPLWNPTALVRWNSDKRYLLDLADAGVSVVPTEVIPRGVRARVDEIAARRGWLGGLVVKPTVSAGARHTAKAQRDDVGALQPLLDEIGATRAMMVQPFLAGVAQGERSLVFVDGALCHAVKKRPRPGDFRTQEEHGARIEPYTPNARELAVAQRALAAVRSPWLYGRVDLVDGDDGQDVLMELELIEPSLFFAHAPMTAVRMAEAIQVRLTRG